jgi:hypothetical protein
LGALGAVGVPEPLSLASIGVASGIIGLMTPRRFRT